MAKKSKNTAPDFMATITKNAKTADNSKKASVAADVLTDAPDNVKADITELLQAKKDAKKAKATITLKEKSVITFGRDYLDNAGFAGNFKKSVKVQGANADDVVNVITANKFSFKQDDVDDIEEILGDDIELETEYVVKVKGEVFTDEAKQKELMALLGDRWTDFFETTIIKKTPEDFDKKLFTLGKDKKADVEVYMKQAKPSVR